MLLVTRMIYVVVCSSGNVLAVTPSPGTTCTTLILKLRELFRSLSLCAPFSNLCGQRMFLFLNPEPRTCCIGVWSTNCQNEWRP